jgi:general secretion pathway protein G
MLIRHETKRVRRAAFTLMEMLVVVAIIVALASIGGFALFSALGEANEDVARMKAATISKACQAYQIKRNRNPDSLDALLQKDDLGGPYIKTAEDLNDPWGKRFQYDQSGTHHNGQEVDIFTTTPEGKTVGNWPVSKGH